MVGSLLLSLLALQQSLSRQQVLELPVVTGASWGPDDRQADHATVATLPNLDILVTWQGLRKDLRAQYGYDLRQVEVSYLRHYSSPERWLLEGGLLLGNVLHDPLSHGALVVKCERPDAIAVGGDWFFVVWTRRYDRSLQGLEKEPAVLECAWVRRDAAGGGLEVVGSGSPGLGFELDRDYHVRECAGVPDAFVLKSSGPPYEVGVVYPHQTDFGDDLGNGDGTRSFELRLVTARLDWDAQNQRWVPSKSPPVVLHPNVRFDGNTYDSAGLILPDTGQGATEDSFVLAYEDQIRITAFPGQQPPSMLRGRIHLERWDRSGGSWEEMGSHVFSGNVLESVLRRRPMVSTDPTVNPGQDIATVAFGRSGIPPSNGEVVFERWQFGPSGVSRLPWTVGNGFPNLPGMDDRRPLPLHGPTSSLPARCFVERRLDTNGTHELRVYDVLTDTSSVLRAGHLVQRPAVDAVFPSGGAPTIAITWEEDSLVLPDSETTRVFLRVE